MALVIELTLVRQAAKIIDRSDTKLLLGGAERRQNGRLSLVRGDHAPLQRLLLRPKIHHALFRIEPGSECLNGNAALGSAVVRHFRNEDVFSLAF